MTGEKLDDFKSTYQGSEEEREDVLKAYKARQGDIDYVFRQVMLSNPLDDEERFREYIDAAIEAGEVEGYQAYTKEKVKKKNARHQLAAREGKEAKEHAKKIGVYDSLFGNGEGKAGKNGSDKGLADLIQQRQKARAGTFLDDLEAKYAGGGQKGGRRQNGGTKRKLEEPPEELFQRNRGKKARASKAKVEEDSDDEISLDDEDTASDFEEEGEDDDDVKPAKSKSKRKTKTNGVAKKRKRAKRGGSKKT